MKQVYTFFLIALSVASFGSVSCAAVTVPTATMNYEKAKTTLVVPAISDGAIVLPFNLFHYDAMFTDVVALNKLNFVVDEHFYLKGYKAKLNTIRVKIIAPPDRKNKIYLDCIKQC